MRQFQVQVLSQISSFFPLIKRGILHYIIFTEEKNFFGMLQHLNQDFEKYYPITYIRNILNIYFQVFHKVEQKQNDVLGKAHRALG